jgi:DNA polymerase III alpha subunit
MPPWRSDGPDAVRIGGLVVTRQHPMTAKGTVFLALEDETGMVNVTLWPDAWARLRGVVRRNALLVVDGSLQRESSVVNVVAHEIRPLVEMAGAAGGPERDPTACASSATPGCGASAEGRRTDRPSAPSESALGQRRFDFAGAGRGGVDIARNRR